MKMGYVHRPDETPVWLLNAEMETLANRYPQDYSVSLAILKQYAPAANRWLDANRVIGNAENQEIAQRIAGVWRSFAVDWSSLPSHPWSDAARQVGIRLIGLGFTRALGLQHESEGV